MQNIEKMKEKGPNRESNIELFRIVLMLMIIAHHYVVNSGITEYFDFAQITPNMIFLQFWGFGGKIGINCFVLITGYFMIKNKWSVRKLLKLYLEIKFYKIGVYVIFLISGYCIFNFKDFIKTVFNIIYGSGNEFTGSFIWIYILIPFINILVENLNQKKYILLILILLTYFTAISTFFMHETWNYVGWMVVIYLIGGYIRLYPHKYFEGSTKWFLFSVAAVLVSWLSIIVVDFIGVRFGFHDYYFMVNNCHKLFALMTAVSMFLGFKNMKLKYNKYLNILASATFGVFLIHANSDIMRKFLWKDVFDVSGWYTCDYLWLHAVLSVIIVYVVCVLIDLVRLNCLEKPLFCALDKRIKWR